MLSRPSWSNDNYSASNCFYGTQRFVTVFTAVCHRHCTCHIFTVYRVAQKLVKYTLKDIRNFFYILLNSQKNVRNKIIHLTTLWCCSTNWLAGLNLYIHVNIRECFRLFDFGPLCVTYTSIRISSNMVLPLKSRYGLYEMLLLFSGINFTLYDTYLFY
jgi:hypothetical protein